MPNGKYDTHVKDRLDTIKAWKRNGLTDRDIAKNLGVGLSTFRRYVNEHRDLWNSLKTGKSDADAKVENALYMRTVGYTYDEIKEITTKDAKGKITGTRREVIKKQVAPDVGAIIFYLINRRPEVWKDRRAFEHSGPGGEPLGTAVIHAYMPPNGRELLPEEKNAK